MCVGLCAWLFGTFAGGLHALLVRHVVCAEHGEMVEVDRHGDEVSAHEALDGDVIRAAVGHGEHDHDCADELTNRTGLSNPSWAGVVGRRVKRPVAPLTGAEAPRGPPLAYAPKTSPPAHA